MPRVWPALGLKWRHALVLQWRNLKHCAVFGTTQILPNGGKNRIFEACVLSKLLYCLHTAWLNKAELRRLNIFQSKCFRKILNISHSFVSRISNKIVLEQSGRQEISSNLTSLITFIWKDCSSAFHRHDEAVRVSWSDPSAPDGWTAAAPRTPKEFLGVQGVQICNRCGRGCWHWRGLVVCNLKQWKILARPLFLQGAHNRAFVCHAHVALTRPFEKKKWYLQIHGKCTSPGRRFPIQRS